MTYNPFKHDRKSLRLKGHDYACDGLYFVTICVQSHKCLFGTVRQDEMVLNDAGQMIEKWWLKLAEKFEGIALYDYVVMPNHFHGIITISRPLDLENYQIPSDTTEGAYTDAPRHGFGVYILRGAIFTPCYKRHEQTPKKTNAPKAQNSGHTRKCLKYVTMNAIMQNYMTLKRKRLTVMGNPLIC